LKAPLEKVLDILNGLRDQIDVDQQQIIADLNYCIKMISGNQLYEAKLDLDGQEGN
jgi:flagellin-specific chaperone FliS